MRAKLKALKLYHFFQVGSALVFICFAALATTKEQVNNPDKAREFEQAGKLVVLKMVPNDKNIKFFVAGKETAALDWSQTQLTVTLTVPDGTKTIPVHKAENYFEIDRTQLGSNKKFKVKADTGKGSESFDLRLK